MRLVAIGLVGLFASVAAAQEMPSLSLDLPPSSVGYMPSQEDAELVFGDAAAALIEREFTKFDPEYPAKIKLRQDRLDQLAKRVFKAEKQGGGLDCSRQIFVEAKWLVGFTAWWTRIDRRLDELEGSLNIQDQTYATAQNEETGLWGRCNDANFIKIEATLEQLFLLADAKELPSRMVALPEFMKTRTDYKNYLMAMLVSDIPRTGENMRSRLGSVTGIHVAMFKKRRVLNYLRQVAGLEPLVEDEEPAYGNTLLGFVDRWQDPASGYWGAWYRDGEKLYKTADLSLTYHIVHARRGNVSYWPELIATTFEMRDQAYPFGWLSDGHWTNHNNYDLVRIFDYGWDHMTDEQRREAQATLQDMLDWCFRETVLPSYDGFRLNPELSSSVGAELYFGVSFLDAIGFFHDGNVPWAGTLRHDEDAELLCQELYDYAVLLTPESYVVSAQRKLERACARHLGDAPSFVFEGTEDD